MEAKLGIMKHNQITPNMIDRAKILAKKYFDEKGYKNAEINIVQREDLTGKNQVILYVDIDKKAKMKVRRIMLIGNEKLKSGKIKGYQGRLRQDTRVGQAEQPVQGKEVHRRALQGGQAAAHREV